jgi:hypothetical protein
LIERFLGQAKKVSLLSDAGTVEQHVDTPKLGYGSAHRFLNG